MMETAVRNPKNAQRIGTITLVTNKSIIKNITQVYYIHKRTQLIWNVLDQLISTQGLKGKIRKNVFSIFCIHVKLDSLIKYVIVQIRTQNEMAKVKILF